MFAIKVLTTTLEDMIGEESSFQFVALRVGLSNPHANNVPRGVTRNATPRRCEMLW